MSFFDRIMGRLEDFIFWAATSVLGAIAASGVWFVRVLLTNQKQIELMQADFRYRDQLRAEDREAIAEIKASVIKIQDHLMKGEHDA